MSVPDFGAVLLSVFGWSLVAAGALGWAAWKLGSPPLGLAAFVCAAVALFVAFVVVDAGGWPRD